MMATVTTTKTYILTALSLAALVGTCASFDLNGHATLEEYARAVEELPSHIGQDFLMPLYIIDDETSAAYGAKCLGGSNPGYYFQPANTTRTPDAANKWVLYFKGGGWAYTAESAAGRSHTELGNSTYFPKQFGFPEGPVSGDYSINPVFADYNRVVLWYCDGASFTGSAAEPQIVDGHPVYYRGFHNLNAMIASLKANHGLGDATDVLLSGGSAGGLSTFIHADYVGSLLSGVKRFKAAPVSGFFLYHADGDGTLLYPDEMNNTYHYQNSSAGVNKACWLAQPQEDKWKCIFANYSYAYTTTPMMPMNSYVDSWQMGNVFKHTTPEWAQCTKNFFAGCDADQINDLNGYANSFLADLNRSPKLMKPGNGVWVDSCLEHCGAQSAGWSQYTNNGNMTMAEAVAAWWDAPDTADSQDHIHLPGCLLRTSAPHQCSSSCCPNNKCP